MNSHFQSSETTSTSIGVVTLTKGLRGSRSCDPIQAIPPRKSTIMAGIDHVTNSIRPEYSHSGLRRARLLLARNHTATTKVQTMTGMTTAIMLAVVIPVIEDQLLSRTHRSLGV